jgi:hypothetical protein
MTAPAAAVESLADTVNRLTAAGYTDDFRAEPNGLRAVPSGCLHAPESLRIDEVVRFEGITDPDDEAVVFALRCGEHGIKGTYALPYGSKMEPLDAEMVRRLNAKKP